MKRLVADFNIFTIKAITADHRMELVDCGIVLLVFTHRSRLWHKVGFQTNQSGFKPEF